MRPGGVGLRARLIVLLLATLIPLVALGIYWIVMEVRREQVRMERAAQETAALVSAEVGRLVSGTQGMLAVLARLPAVQKPDRGEVARLFHEILPNSTHLENFLLVGADGVLLASAVSVPPTAPIHLEDRDWFRRTIQSGQASVGGFQVGRVTGKPVAVLSQPVLDSSGRVTGLVTAALRLAAVSQEVAPARIKAPVVWAVVDEQGVVLLHSEPWGAIGRPLGPLTGMRRAEAIPPGTPWRAVVGIPEPSVVGALRQVLLVVGLPTLLILLAASGVALWLARDIWRPLQALTAAVRRITEGGRQFQVSMKGAGEVGEIATALHDALSAVTGREAELARRNKEFMALVEATRAIASSLDLEQILQTIVGTAASMAGVPAVRLFLVDEEAQALRWRAGVGLPSDEERDLQIPYGESFSGQVVATGKPVAVSDTRADPRLRYPQHAMQYGLVSYLGLPVKVAGRVLGVLVYNTQAPRSYSNEEVAYLSTFADQAAIAIENARLHEAALRRTEQFARLNELTQTLVRSLDVDTVAREILMAIGSLIPDAAGQLWAWVPEAAALRLISTIRLREPAGTIHRELRLNEGLAGKALAAREVLVSRGVSDDERFMNRAWARAEELRAAIALPLVHRDSPEGALVVFRRGRLQFTDEEMALVRSFAAHATLAMVNAKLHGAVQRQASELERRVRERTLELEEALRVKVEFLGKMSHELRTPLNFVIGFSELLHQGIGGPLTPKQVTYLERVLASGKRLLSLVNDVLDIAQLDTGKSRLHLEPVILGPLVQEILGLVRVQATPKRLKVITAPDPWLPFVVADRFKLSQILHNLVGNAVKFTPEDGLIRIVTRQVPTGDDAAREGGTQLPASSNSVELLVEDTGIGIRPEDLETIFGPFYQVDGSETRAYGGAGLGLTLARKLVELHGGRVWAESSGLGQGSRFVVRLPRLEVPKAKRILLVEDESLLRIPMASALESGGFAVVDAATGADALAAMESGGFDLLILDIVLPDLNGWEILRRIREAEDIRTLPVLVVTGLESVSAEQALALGADEFLTKPVSPRVLVETVVRLLA